MNTLDKAKVHTELLALKAKLLAEETYEDAKAYAAKIKKDASEWDDDDAEEKENVTSLMDEISNSTQDMKRSLGEKLDVVAEKLKQ